MERVNRKRLGFQPMLGDAPLQVLRLSEVSGNALGVPHRHAFMMLWWTTAGTGLHRVNYLDYELSPGLVFFMHEGQVHEVLRYPEDGWLVLFSTALFREYLRLNPRENGVGLFALFSRTPFVRLTREMELLLQGLLPLLRPDSACLQANLGAVLCNLNRAAGPQLIRPEAQELLARLSALVEQHYVQEREAVFYADRLGVSSRKLNEVVEAYWGRSLHELLVARLLSECELLLGRDVPIKTIIAELGFNDHAHFAFFFKKHKGLTPSAFRRALRDDNCTGSL